MCTASGEQHGLINTLANSVPFDDFKSMKPEVKAKCEKAKKEDNRMVKARYINHRGRHERLSKPYCRWSGDPILQYHLIPGNTYDLPLGFINEVNAVRIPKRSGLVSVDGDELNNGTPLDKDTAGEAVHELVPTSF
jgi:hypothetical protein